MEKIIIENLHTNNWFNYQEFYNFISEKNYKVFVEVGVWKGHSITYLAQKLKEKNEDFELYAVDLFENTFIEEWNQGIKELPFIYEIYNEYLKLNNVRDSIKDLKGISWEMSENFDEKSVDFVFIDAGHDYDSVLKDIKNWLPKVKKGGIISGHDFFNAPGVKKAVEELVDGYTISPDQIWYKQI